MSQTTIHATCVAKDGRGILIMGPSGSGKSDLTLRLIDRGFVLVSDDYCHLRPSGEGLSAHLLATPPTNIAGMLEVRHIGIVNLPYAIEMPIALAIALEEKPERMPDHPVTLDLLGRPIPCVSLAGLEASAPIKVEMALARHGLSFGTT